jgi:dihydroxyacid dehydratase/phosphogluconate dehydratase
MSDVAIRGPGVCAGMATANTHELAKRRARLSKWSSTEERGWLAIYRDLLEPVDKGRVLRR